MIPVDVDEAEQKHDWKTLHAFGWPAGSVRAVLALLVFGSIWALIALRPERPLPPYLQNLLFIVMGHYFASRSRPVAEVEAGPPPLYLPRGSVRLFSILGFVGVAAWLAWIDELLPLRAGRGSMTLVLVAGFLLGVMASRVRSWMFVGDRRSPRWLEDLRAGVSLGAAVVLVGLVLNRTFGWVELPDTLVIRGLEVELGRNGPEELLAATVGFYFGSRS